MILAGEIWGAAGAAGYWVAEVSEEPGCAL